MNNIKSLAYNFLLETKIDSFPITLKKLDSVLSEGGSALLPYSRALQILPELPEVLRMEIIAAMEANPGLTVVFDNSSFVLYSDELSYGERLLVAAHEIGHRYIGHKRSGVYVNDNLNTVHEQEAHAFARYMLAPPCIFRLFKKLSADTLEQLTGLDRAAAETILKTISADPGKYSTAQEKELQHQFRHYINDNNNDSKLKKAILPIALAAILAIGIMLPFSRTHKLGETQGTATYQTSAPTAMAVPEPAETTVPAAAREATVWKSKTGQIYHTDPNCYHIPKTAYPMNLSDAITVGYRKCLDCKD